MYEKKEICTYLSEPGSLEPGDERCTITYGYKYECTMGSDGTGDYSNDPAPDDPDGLPRTGGTTSPTYPEEEKEIVEEKIVNEIQNPCGSLIFNQLLLLSTNYLLTETVNDPDVGSLKFLQAILNMFNEATNADYRVKEEFMSNSELSGYTDPDPLWNSATGRYEITTYLNSQYLSTATRVSTARSMIHESIHAYLVYQQRLNTNREVYELVSSYAESNGFSNNLNIIHHEFMAQFVNSIAYHLKLWDRNHGTGGNLGWQYYHDMAWGGLANYRDLNDNTKVLFYAEFEEYLRSLDDPTTTTNESSGVKERILNTIKNEANNNSNAKGDDCP